MFVETKDPTRLEPKATGSDEYCLLVLGMSHITETKRNLKDFSLKLEFDNNLKELAPYQKELYFRSSNEMVNFRQITSINTKSKIKCDYELTIKKKVLNDENIEEILRLEEHWKSTEKYRKLDFPSNFTFIVKNEHFQVNKNIMIEASDVMRTMFTGNYDESHGNSTQIKYIESDVFGVLVKFVYGDREEFEKSAKTELLIELFEAAHKYNISTLERYCLARIFKELTDKEDIFDTYCFAWEYDIKELQDYCWDMVQESVLEYFVSYEPMSAVKVKELLNHMNKVENLVNEWNNLKDRIQKELVFCLDSDDSQQQKGMKASNRKITFEKKFDLRI